MQNVSDMNDLDQQGKEPEDNYVIVCSDEWAAVDAAEWNALLAEQATPTPFMRHEYLSALHETGCAGPDTGWALQLFTLRADGPQAASQPLLAAVAVYVKSHSYGEYVFDWAWADAYARNGLDYYPKALIAVPFTPVPGSRILARTPEWRAALLQTLTQWARDAGLSSLHLLFGDAADLEAADAAGLMVRQGVQFHWRNREPERYGDFDDFLAGLSHDKRKKIRQERRKVADAGVAFDVRHGTQIRPQDWDYFYRCYEQTYLEHGNAPYLNREFFGRMAHALADRWVLFTAHIDGRPVACSLLAIHPDAEGRPQYAYGRYWGSTETVACLHFEACYYQPIAWCIANGVQRFEGGAQGEHKMARALMPQPTASAHWLAHPAFADAVGHFLERETQGMDQYLESLRQRSPFKR